jgi:hypothetical protein
MIRVLGGEKRLCDGLTRRDLLHAGALGLLGFGLVEDLFDKGARGSPFDPAIAHDREPAERSRSRSTSFGKAKSCILIHLYGSPSQLETFDPKPAAPVEIRGEFGAIESNVPGALVCDRLPRIAQIMNKVTVLRSVTHQYPIHGVAYALTGIPRIELDMELNPRDARHWPFVGSVVDYLDSIRDRGSPEIPRNILLPWAFSSRRVGEVARAGPYGGFLGTGYDPTCVEFSGRATKKARKTLNERVWDDFEPYRGIAPEGRFRLAVDSADHGDVTLDRLNKRRSLLDQIESARRTLDLPAVDRRRDQAMRLLGSRKLRDAFDLEREPRTLRDDYGMTLFGQAALTARRLIEAGGRFATIFWDEYGLAGSGWDTHWDHYQLMKNELLPGLDQTLPALLRDLDARGMLDETLVIVISEHGRTPKISAAKGGGRDHWSRCYSVLLAGGGIARGRIVGRSDKIASDPVERPISPKDILATAYHLLGFDLDTLIFDRQNRPLPIVSEGSVIEEALA